MAEGFKVKGEPIAKTRACEELFFYAEKAGSHVSLEVRCDQGHSVGVVCPRDYVEIAIQDQVPGELSGQGCDAYYKIPKKISKRENQRLGDAESEKRKAPGLEAGRSRKGLLSRLVGRR